MPGSIRFSVCVDTALVSFLHKWWALIANVLAEWVVIRKGISHYFIDCCVDFLGKFIAQ